MNEDANIKRISENLAIDLDDTMDVEGETLYRLIAIADFKIDTIFIHKDDKGGYISSRTDLQDSWLDSNSYVIGYKLIDTLLINSSLVQDDIKDFDPDYYQFNLAFIRKSFLHNTNITANRRLCIFKSSIDNFCAKPKNTTDDYVVMISFSTLSNTTIEIDDIFIRESTIESCFLSGTIFVDNVRFNDMWIENYFACTCDIRSRNKSVLKLHGLKLNYKKDDLPDSNLINHFSHVINHLGSRHDNLSIYTVFYRKEDDDIGADTYVSTGCFCGTLDEFKKAVEKKYKGDKEYAIHNTDYLYGKQYEATIRYIEDLVASHIIYLKN